MPVVAVLPTIWANPKPSILLLFNRFQEVLANLQSFIAKTWKVLHQNLGHRVYVRHSSRKWLSKCIYITKAALQNNSLGKSFSS